MFCWKCRAKHHIHEFKIFGRPIRCCLPTCVFLLACVLSMGVGKWVSETVMLSVYPLTLAFEQVNWLLWKLVWTLYHWRTLQCCAFLPAVVNKHGMWIKVWGGIDTSSAWWSWSNGLWWMLQQCTNFVLVVID